jgi:hypothetical protein
MVKFLIFLANVTTSSAWLAAFEPNFSLWMTTLKAATITK